MEEHYPRGGLGGAVAELVSGTFPVVVNRVAVPHVYVPTGPYAEILKSFGLDAVGLEAKIRELVSQHREVGPLACLTTAMQEAGGSTKEDTPSHPRSEFPGVSAGPRLRALHLSGPQRTRRTDPHDDPRPLRSVWDRRVHHPLGRRATRGWN